MMMMCIHSCGQFKKEGYECPSFDGDFVRGCVCVCVCERSTYIITITSWDFGKTNNCGHLAEVTNFHMSLDWHTLPRNDKQFNASARFQFNLLTQATHISLNIHTWNRIHIHICVCRVFIWCQECHISRCTRIPLHLPNFDKVSCIHTHHKVILRSLCMYVSVWHLRMKCVLIVHWKKNTLKT